MRNTAIFSFVRVSENSMVASVRIARWLSNFLEVPLWDDASIASKRLDTLIIVNGAYGFSKHLEPLSRAILGAERIVWVQNDYTIIPPKDEGDAESPFRRAFVTRRERGDAPVSFWSTCHKWSERPGSHYVNWNMLTFDSKYDPREIARRRKVSDDVLAYYGSYRDGSGKSSRVPLFDRYFRVPAVKTIISSPVDKFQKRYPNCAHMVSAVPGSLYEWLGGMGLGLYIEDRKSSEEFHSPANRFYEMLSAGLPMVFAPECGTMLRRAGFDPTPYQTGGGISLKGMMRDRESIGEAQRRAWVPDRLHFRNALIDQVNAARAAL